MKYGSLVDSQVTAVGLAGKPRSSGAPSSTMCYWRYLLTVVALASMWRGAVHGAAAGGVPAFTSPPWGPPIATAQHLLDRELNALGPGAVRRPRFVRRPVSRCRAKPARIADEATRSSAVSGRERLRCLRRSVAYSAPGAGVGRFLSACFSQIGTVVAGLGVNTVQRAYFDHARR